MGGSGPPSNIDKTIADIRLRPRCAIPRLPSRP